MPANFKKLSLALVALTLLLGLSACNTVQGFGRDVEKVGEEIQEGAV